MSKCKKLRTPDAIHLATAIMWQAEELHTFDTDLLSLNDNVAGHNLKICKPESKQLSFDLRAK